MSEILLRFLMSQTSNKSLSYLYFGFPNQGLEYVTGYGGEKENRNVKKLHLTDCFMQSSKAHTAVTFTNGQSGGNSRKKNWPSAES